MHFGHPTDEQLRHVYIYIYIFLATKIICSLSTLTALMANEGTEHQNNLFLTYIIIKCKSSATTLSARQK